MRYRDGRQEHLAGPAEVSFDPRVHLEISREEMLQVAAKEAVVVYSQKEGTTSVQRRIEYGPTLFMPPTRRVVAHVHSGMRPKGARKACARSPRGWSSRSSG